jgi:hypothetical protein
VHRDVFQLRTPCARVSIHTKHALARLTIAEKWNVF